MPLHQCIDYVLSNYISATAEPYSQHPMAGFIRTDLRSAVAAALPNNSRLKFKGSAGQSKWVRGPWLGIFDTLVTSAQRGF